MHRVLGLCWKARVHGLALCAMSFAHLIETSLHDLTSSNLGRITDEIESLTRLGSYYVANYCAIFCRNVALFVPRGLRVMTT